MAVRTRNGVFAMIFVALAGLAAFGYNALFVEHPIHYGQCGDAQPISVPFAVEKAGNRLTCEFVIEEAGGYGVYLSYFRERGAKVSKGIREIAGGYEYDEHTGVWKDVRKGGPMVIHYVVQPVGGGPVIRDAIKAHPRIRSWDSERYNAVLGAFDLLPGRYTVTVESMKDVPEMAAVPTAMTVEWYSVAK